MTYEPKDPLENQETPVEKDVVNGDDQFRSEGHGRGPDEPVYGETYEEEFAAETAAVPIHKTMKPKEQETTMQKDVKAGMGWIGLSVAILSFFFAPLILGAAGIILGIISKRRGADTLGNMAIIISVISIAFSIFFTSINNFI